MSFLEKIFNKKNQPTNKPAFDFIDRSQDCEKWFENDHQILSNSLKNQASKYVEEFGLEKHSNNFPLLQELKNAIADYFIRCGIFCEASNIIVRAGIFEILQDLYRTINFKNGEQILFALPVSGYFIQQCYDNEISPHFLNTDSANGWKIDFDDLQEILKKQPIKALFLNYPNSISGATFNKKDAEILTEIIRQYPDLLVIIDESLRELFLNANQQTFSPAAISEISQQIITISNLKCYGLENLDIAFACIKNKNILNGLFSDHINISLANQHIAIEALKNDEDNQRHLTEIVENCNQNFSLLAEELKTINENLSQKFGKKEEFVKAMNDESKNNNSALLKFDGLKGSKAGIDNQTLETDLDIAEFLKKETGIVMMPGQCFLLPEEEMILRLYLLKSKQELQAGFKKINQALMQLKMLRQNISVFKSSQLGSKSNYRGK